jgi:hypothetical protein
MRTRRILAIAAALGALLGWGLSARAQQTAATLPAIVQFASDKASVRLDEVEQVEVMATFSWQVVNMAAEHRIVLEQLSLNNWVSNYEIDAVLPPVGSRTITIVPPLNFSPPTFRLVVLDAQQQVVSQAYLTIPYDASALEDATPTVEEFTVEAPGVDVNDLVGSSVRLPVSWEVTGRPPTANLVFIQVLPDGQEILVELPRPNLRVPSRGQGVVSPVQAAADHVDLRLRLVDMVSGEVYAEQRVNLPITGTLRPTPAQTAVPPTARPAAWRRSCHSPPARPGRPGGDGHAALAGAAPEVKITWVRASSIEYAQYAERAGLPPRGSLIVDLREVWFYNGDTTTFALYAPHPNPEVGWGYIGDIILKLKHNMVVRSFTANPASARRGDAVTLSWDVANAVRVSIPAALPDGGSENLPPQGSITVTFPQEIYYSTANYQIWATDANGVTLHSEPLEIPVLCSFISQLADVCPYAADR